MPDPAKALNIFLVEDNAVDVEVVKAQLALANSPVSLETVGTLEAAAQSLKKGSFDVVLLDLTLPDSQGLATFQLLQSHVKDIPIIVLTGLDDTKLGLQAVREGAQDYLLKNKIDSDLLIRSIRYALERSRRKRAESELIAAGSIQRRLLPRPTLTIPGFDVSGRCRPANFAGGDFFDYFAMGKSELGVVIADAAGHGLGPAITMSETRAVIRSFASVTPDVGEILTRANRLLARDLTQDTFVALFLACIDVASNTLQFATAGHPGFILMPNGNTKQLLKSDNPPLGIERSAEYRSSVVISLDPGDSLFLFTDGFAESVSSGGESFGKRRVFEAAKERSASGATAMVDHLFEQLDAFLGGAQLGDDLTAVVVKASPPVTEPVKKAPEKHDEAHEAVAHREYQYFEVDTQQGVALLRIREEEILSSEKCAAVKTELAKYIQREKPMRVVLSFHSVKRFSSEGINICFQIKSVIDATDGQLRLCEMAPPLRDAFKALNLDGTVFEIHDDVGKALSSF